MGISRHRATGLGASRHPCIQTRVMLTYRDTGARTYSENPYKDACQCKMFTHRETSSGRAHTSPHIPRHPFLPIPDPMPSLPLPSHLPGPIPSIKLLKQVSQQPGRGKVSVCPSLHPHPSWPSSACPSPQTRARHGMHTLLLHMTAQRWGTRRRKASSQPHTPAPQPQTAPYLSVHPLDSPKLGSLSGCQGWFGTGLVV